MKLTKEQVEYLFTFTRQHFVEYFDVQSELVDHLANAIENDWIANPNLSFEEALNKEFKKFGVFGFMGVVEQKQKQLRKKYHSIIWSNFKAFFDVSKIVGTCLSIFALYSFMTRMEDPKMFVMLFYFVFLVVIFYKLFKNKKEQKKEQKKWLLKEIILNFGSTNAVLVLLFQILNSSSLNLEKYLDKSTFTLVLAVVVVSITFFGYIILYVIPLKAEYYLRKTYPEYNLV